MLLLPAMLTVPRPRDVLHELRGRLRLKRTIVNERSPAEKRWAWLQENTSPEVLAMMRALVGPFFKGDAYTGRALLWLATVLESDDGLPQPHDLKELAIWQVFSKDFHSGWEGYQELVEQGHIPHYRAVDLDGYADMLWNGSIEELKDKDEYDLEAEWGDYLDPGTASMRWTADGVSIEADVEGSEGAVLQRRARPEDRMALSLCGGDDIPLWIRDLVQGENAEAAREELDTARLEVRDAIPSAVWEEHEDEDGELDDEYEQRCQEALDGLYEATLSILHETRGHYYDVIRDMGYGWRLVLYWQRTNPGQPLGDLPIIKAIGLAIDSHRQRLVDSLRTCDDNPWGLSRGDPVPDVDGDIVWIRFHDGAVITQLIEVEALQCEGASMNHCIGSEKEGHPKLLRAGEVRVFSYRDTDNIPHATWEVSSHNWHSTSDLQGRDDNPVSDRYVGERMAAFIWMMRCCHDPKRGVMALSVYEKDRLGSGHKPAALYSALESSLADVTYKDPRLECAYDNLVARFSTGGE